MVHCSRTVDGPRVAEVVAVEDLAAAADAARFTVTPLFERPRATAPLAWTGNVPVRAARALREAGIDLGPILDPDGRARHIDQGAASGAALDARLVER